MFCKPAPATADLEDLLIWLGVGQLQDTVVFSALGLMQGLVLLEFVGRGVGHGFVQPMAVEIIAQVVMERDVAFAACKCVCICQMAQACEGS